MRKLSVAAACLPVLMASGVAFSQAPQLPASAASGAATSPGWAAELPLKRDAESQQLVPGAYGAWLIVLVVAVGGMLWMRRSQKGRAGWLTRFRPVEMARAPKVIAVKSLGPQASLQVVEWNDRELLLGCSSQGVTLLDSRPLPEPNAVDSAAAAGRSAQ